MHAEILVLKYHKYSPYKHSNVSAKVGGNAYQKQNFEKH
jgi:hypothetical protein